MLYLGAMTVIFAAFLIWKEYSSYLSGQLQICRSFLDALRDFSEKVRCYLTSPKEWAGEYSDEHIQGFLDAVGGGESLLLAYAKEKSGWCIAQSFDDALVACFSRIGDGDLTAEIGTLEIAIGKLSRAESTLAEELVKKRKAVGAILGACASGIVILII